MRTLFTILATTLALFAALPVLAAAPGAKRVTSASSVRIRSTPSTTGAVVATLPLGELLDELGRSDQPQKVGDVSDYWYRVAISGGRQGWVFGGLTRAVDPDKLDDAYLKIARDRLDTEGLSLADLIDLYGFLGRAAASAQTRDARAELECSRLRALRSAMYAVEDGKKDQEPFRSFLAATKDKLVYSEPGGVWLVESEHFWNLYDQYRDTSYAERLAWEAAQNLLPGECETDEECNLTAYLMTTGRYVKLYPHGSFISDALLDLDELVNQMIEFGSIASGETVGDAAATAEWKAAARKALASTRELVVSTDNPAKPHLLDRIDQLAKRFE